MKFFIPKMGPENAEVFYAGIRTFLAEQLGFPLTDRRVQRLSYTNKGQRHEAVVGRQLQTGHETVFAILETPQAYLICTPRQGVAGQLPVVVKRKDVVELVDFDSAEAQQTG
jgi:hypothetical protein